MANVTTFKNTLKISDTEIQSAAKAFQVRNAFGGTILAEMQADGDIVSSKGITINGTADADFANTVAGDYFPGFTLARTGGSSYTNASVDMSLSSSGSWNFKHVTANRFPLVCLANGIIHLGADASALYPKFILNPSTSQITTKNTSILVENDADESVVLLSPTTGVKVYGRIRVYSHDFENVLGEIDNNGNFLSTTGTLFLYNPTVPSTATSSGTAGQISWDANFWYVCVGTNQWKRAALSTW